MPSPAVLGVVAASVLWVLETAVVEPSTHVGTVDLLTETCQRAAVPNRLSIVPASGVCQQTVLSNALGMLASKRVTAGAREYQACMGSTKHAWVAASTMKRPTQEASNRPDAVLRAGATRGACTSPYPIRRRVVVIAGIVGVVDG